MYSYSQRGTMKNYNHRLNLKLNFYCTSQEHQFNVKFHDKLYSTIQKSDEKTTPHRRKELKFFLLQSH